MSNRYAPAGKLWLCMMCGKTASDYCTEAGGWDESCALNCILVDEATKQPTDEQVREFEQARQRMFSTLAADWSEMMANIGNTDGSDIDPELLALAQRAIDRLDELAITPGKDVR